MKRGQISLLLIVGIVILIITGLLYLAKSTLISSPTTSPENVQLYVSETLSVATKHCLVMLGLHGGQGAPVTGLESEFGNVGYGYKNENIFLSQDELERELAGCVQDRLLTCIDNFQTLEELRIDVSAREPLAKPVLGAYDTGINLEFPVTVVTSDSRKTFSDFNTNLPVRLQALHNATATISADRSNYEQPSDFDLSYLGKLDIDTSIYQFGDEQVYELRDHQSRLDSELFVFLSANAFEE